MPILAARPTTTRTREPLLPLVISMAAAVALHALLLPAATWWNLDDPDTAEARQLPTVDAPQAQPPDDPVIGQKSSQVSSVAWIAYDDFRALIAPQSTVEQPALQQQEDPVPDAAPTLDPTPPAPTTPPEPVTPPEPPTPQRLAEAITPIPLASPPSPAPPLDLPEPVRTGDLPPFRTARTEPQPDHEAETEPVPEASPPPPPMDASEARPTSSPRSDRESPPVALTASQLPVQPGRVVARQGIEIKTAAPRFSAITRASTLPRNPEAILTFDNTGQVVEVALTRSAGAANVDGPVVASLYRWRATGERIDQLGDGLLTVDVKILLVEE